MLPLGHMGIGSKLVSPWAAQLPPAALLLGTLLPDLIDKPLYYGMSWATGLRGAELGLISGTRTFGHTAILLLAVTLLAVVRRSRVLAAIALGMATHLFLDNLEDRLLDRFNPLEAGMPDRDSALVALLFPFYKRRFAAAPFNDLADHALRSLKPIIVGPELAGAAILGWDWWKKRHESEILRIIYARKHRRRERRKLR